MNSIDIDESCGDRRLTGAVLGLAGLGLAVVAIRALRLGAVAGWLGVEALKSAVAPNTVVGSDLKRADKQ